MTEILLPIAVLGIMGALFGVLLGVAARVFRVEKDERIDKVSALLAGANCGGCGYPGCGAYAEALCRGEASLGACPSTKAENIDRIAAILGVSSEPTVKKVAKVMCSGTCNSAAEQCAYEGIHDCVAAARYGGTKACSFGCLGFGSCAEVCPFQAISVHDNLAVVDPEKCTACGKCKDICPMHVIDIIEKEQKVYVSCKSQDKGASLKNICSQGCIGCRICEKSCPRGAITVENNLAHIDYGKCVNCGICAQKCPRKIIVCE